MNRTRTEHRWPAIIAVLLALTLYALLPSSFLPVLRYSVVVVCLGLLIPLVIINPIRMRSEKRWSRILSIVLTAVLAVANTIALVQLVILLLQPDADEAGTLLLAATQVWTTHVIVFALIFWEMDRGGPVVRTTAKRENLPQADIRFPQDEDARRRHRGGEGLLAEVGLDRELHRLCVLLAREHDGLQSARRDAAQLPGEDPRRTPGARRVRHPRARDRARGVAVRLTAACQGLCRKSCRGTGCAS